MNLEELKPLTEVELEGFRKIISNTVETEDTLALLPYGSWLMIAGRAFKNIEQLCNQKVAGQTG